MFQHVAKHLAEWVLSAACYFAAKGLNLSRSWQCEAKRIARHAPFTVQLCSMDGRFKRHLCITVDGMQYVRALSTAPSATIQFMSAGYTVALLCKLVLKKDMHAAMRAIQSKQLTFSGNLIGLLSVGKAMRKAMKA